MLFWILLAAFVVAFVATLLIDGWRYEWAKIFMILVSTALGVLTIVLGVGIIITNMTADSMAAEYEVRYEALTYQLENEMYEQDSECGKQQLMTQIMEYNAEIAAGRVGQGNIWYGIFVPDIYNDLALIEMGNE